MIYDVCLENIQKLKLWKKVLNGEATDFSVPGYQLRRSFSIHCGNIWIWSLDAEHIKLVPKNKTFSITFYVSNF